MAGLQTKHPIVLLHGAAGFVQLPGIGVEYFRDVRALYEEEGNRVYAWKVPNFGVTVPMRARELMAHLMEKEHRAPFNLIAHSMGGLDARCMTSQLRGAGLVASLTTIATPHHGTALAEIRNSVLNGVGILSAAKRSGSPFAKEMETFTYSWAKRFNDENPPAEGVFHRAWAGEAPMWRVCPLFQPLMPALTKREGPNDGVVSVDSARWCDEIHAGTIQADHFAQLGWKLGLNRLDDFDHCDFYRRILRDLVEAGL